MQNTISSLTPFKISLTLILSSSFTFSILIYSKFVHCSNIDSILVTKVISKLDKFKDVNELQSSNILSIDFTFSVLKLDKSSDSRLVQLTNIELISMTAIVLKFVKSNDSSAQKQNILFIFITFEVSK